MPAGGVYWNGECCGGVVGAGGYPEATTATRVMKGPADTYSIKHKIITNKCVISIWDLQIHKEVGSFFCSP